MGSRDTDPRDVREHMAGLGRSHVSALSGTLLEDLNNHLWSPLQSQNTGNWKLGQHLWDKSSP